MKKISVLCLCAGILSFSACKEIDTSTLKENQGTFILNAGNSSSTISYYNFEKEKCENNYFQAKNSGQTLGENARSIAIRKGIAYPDGRAYVSVAGTGSEGHVEVIDMASFKSIAVIDGISYPGDVVLVSETIGYVTSGNGTGSESDEIIELDLTTNATGKSIQVGKAPVKMVTSGKHLYVANKGTEAEPDNQITVIDLSRGAIVVDRVEVGMAPIDMDVDKYGNVWVYCNGTGVAADQSLVKLEKNFVEVDGELKLEHYRYIIPFGERKGQNDNCLTMSKFGGELFYVHGGTYRMDVDVELETIEDIETALPTEPCIKGDYASTTFNSINVDPRTGNFNALTGDANGELIIFKIGNTYLTQLNEKGKFDVGISPIETEYNY